MLVKMNLRDLNKDMLVKLIETIQKDKEKRIDELEELLEEYKSVVTSKNCNKEGCECLTIEGFSHSKILRASELFICDNCQKYTCEEHIGMRTSYCAQCY